MLSPSRKNKQIFILSDDVTQRSARAPRYGRRHFQFSYKKYHSDNFFVNSRLWGMLSSSRKKYIKFIRAKLCLWGPRAHARTRARTRYGRGTYLWISFKLLWILHFLFFYMKACNFSFLFMYITYHLTFFFPFGFWNKRFFDFVYTRNLFKNVPKTLYFLEINKCLWLYT